MTPRRRFKWTVLVASVAALVAGGCDEKEPPTQYVARVGDSYLLSADVERALTTIPAAQDSSDARLQIIEQWVTSELLYQEAERRGLREEDDVQEMLEDSERSVLVNSLLSHLYDENEVVPSTSEMRAYFERHREQLRLRESFVRVRYLQAKTREEAEEARQAIQAARIPDRDSVWTSLVDRYSTDKALSTEISSNYYPENRIFAGKPALQEPLGRLLDGQTSPVVEVDSVFTVIQLAARVPANTVPQPEWIEEELARRLIIQGRKQLYARQVQRLRNEALAREDLEIKQ